MQGDGEVTPERGETRPARADYDPFRRGWGRDDAMAWVRELVGEAAEDVGLGRDEAAGVLADGMSDDPDPESWKLVVSAFARGIAKAAVEDGSTWGGKST